MRQELYELPAGWEWIAWTDALEIIGGKNQKDVVADDGQYAIYGSGGEMGRATKFLCPAYTTIIGRKGTINKPQYIEQPFWNVDTAFGLAPNEQLDTKLFFYFCCSFNFLTLNRSTTLPSLTKRDLYTLKIPLPPLNEQKRIVAKLDALFTRIDTAITHLQQTIELSKALFESASAHVFNNGDEWDTVKLSVLLERGWIISHLDGNHGSNYPRKAEFVDEGVPYISANCLRNGEVIMSLSKFLTPQRASMLRKGIAMNNDVLFAHNATVGPVAILQTDCEKVVLSTSLTYYRCDPKFIFPEYLAQYMKAAPFTSQYRAVMSQSTRNQVPITKQREFKFIVPPLNEQSRIAAQLDELSKRTQTLEATTQEKINDLTTLKASLLDAAFKGRL